MDFCAVGFAIFVVTALVVWWMVMDNKKSSKDDTETVSTEDSSPAVTTAPSPPGNENTGFGCLVLTVILFVLAWLWFNSWLKEQKRKSDARKREFQNGVKKWMRLFKGGG